MILVGIVINKRSFKVVSKFNDESMDTAIALGENIVAHQKVKVVIALDHKEKPLIIKRIKMNWRGRVKVQ